MQIYKIIAFTNIMLLYEERHLNLMMSFFVNHQPAQEPSVFVIKSLQDVVNSYTDFRSVYGSLQISINVTSLC